MITPLPHLHGAQPPFVQLRHKPPVPLERPRELVVACAAMNTPVILSQIVRMAGCSGIGRVIVCGRPRLDRNITRESIDRVMIEQRNSLPPILTRLRDNGHEIVALEQATGAESLHTFAFPRRAVLVVGNERAGVDEKVLRLAQRVVEIPVYGLPYSYNAATAAMIAIYEYCRQFPSG